MTEPRDPRIIAREQAVKLQRKLEERILKILDRAFKRVAAKFTRTIAASAPLDLAAAGRPVDQVELQRLAAYWDVEVPQILEVLERVYLTSTDVAFRRFVPGTSLRSSVAARFVEEAAERLSYIGEELATSASRALSAGILEGEGYDALRDRLIEEFSREGTELSEVRAERIARTQVHEAWERGTKDAAVAMEDGPRFRSWLATIDERTRPAHWEADGQVVGIDDPFIVDGEELMYPGDPNGSPGNVIQCRCTTVLSETPEPPDDTGRQYLDDDEIEEMDRYFEEQYGVERTVAASGKLEYEEEKHPRGEHGKWAPKESGDEKRSEGTELLLRNAQKFYDAGGKIEVRAATEQEIQDVKALSMSLVPGVETEGIPYVLNAIQPVEGEGYVTIMATVREGDRDVVAGAVSYGLDKLSRSIDEPHLMVGNLGSTGFVKGVGSALIAEVTQIAANDHMGIVAMYSSSEVKEFYEALGARSPVYGMSGLVGLEADEVQQKMGELGRPVEEIVKEKEPAMAGSVDLEEQEEDPLKEGDFDPDGDQNREAIEKYLEENPDAFRKGSPEEEDSVEVILTGDELEAAAHEEFTGAFIGLVPSDPEALALKGFEPADRLHMTLVFLGEAADQPLSFEDTVSAVGSLELEAVPVEADCMGYAVLNPNGGTNPKTGDDLEPALVLMYQSDSLSELRAGLVDTFGDPAGFPVWIPHITLGYSVDPVEYETVTGKVKPVTFDRIRIAYGDQVEDISLGGSEMGKTATEKELHLPGQHDQQDHAGGDGGGKKEGGDKDLSAVKERRPSNNQQNWGVEKVYSYGSRAAFLKEPMPANNDKWEVIFSGPNGSGQEFISTEKRGETFDKKSEAVQYAKELVAPKKKEETAMNNSEKLEYDESKHPRDRGRWTDKEGGEKTPKPIDKEKQGPGTRYWFESPKDAQRFAEEKEKAGFVIMNDADQQDPDAGPSVWIGKGEKAKEVKESGIDPASEAAGSSGLQKETEDREAPKPIPEEVEAPGEIVVPDPNRIRALTMVDLPAFSGARIKLEGEPDENGMQPWVSDPAVAYVNKTTGDGRKFLDMLWAEPPLPLRWAPEDEGYHFGAVVVGRIDEVGREGDMMVARGVIDTNLPEGKLLIRMMENSMAGGVSADLDWDEPKDEGEPTEAPDKEATMRPETRSEFLLPVALIKEVSPELAGFMESVNTQHISTLQMPKFLIGGLCEKYGEDKGFITECMGDAGEHFEDGGAFCNWLENECLGTWETGMAVRTATLKVEKKGDEWCAVSEDGKQSFGCYPTEDEANERIGEVEFFKAKKNEVEIEASAWDAVSDAPPLPAEWFKEPDLPQDGGAILADGGRIFGWIARRGVPHEVLGVKPPIDDVDLTTFLRHRIRLDDGSEIAAGAMTMNVGHHRDGAECETSSCQFDDTRTVAGIVTVGTNDGGMWFSGAAAPWLSEWDRRVFSACQPSGHWRKLNTGRWSLRAVLTVPVPGYPTPLLAASVPYVVHRSNLAIAASALPDEDPEKDDEEEDEEETLMARVERLEQSLRRSEVERLAAMSRPARLEALKMKLMNGNSKRRLHLDGQHEQKDHAGKDAPDTEQVMVDKQRGFTLPPDPQEKATAIEKMMDSGYMEEVAEASMLRVGDVVELGGRNEAGEFVPGGEIVEIREGEAVIPVEEGEPYIDDSTGVPLTEQEAADQGFDTGGETVPGNIIVYSDGSQTVTTADATDIPRYYPDLDSAVAAYTYSAEQSIAEAQSENPDINPDDVYREVLQNVLIDAPSEVREEAFRREGIESPEVASEISQRDTEKEGTRSGIRYNLAAVRKDEAPMNGKTPTNGKEPAAEDEAVPEDRAEHFTWKPGDLELIKRQGEKPPVQEPAPTP